ncbi:MAG: JAB domain-containing protein [Chloroflexota bacterium]
MSTPGAFDTRRTPCRSLDTRNRVLGIEAVYKGSLNSSVVRIAELFRPAIEAPAAAILIAHNHPRAMSLLPRRM